MAHVLSMTIAGGLPGVCFHRSGFALCPIPVRDRCLSAKSEPAASPQDALHERTLSVSHQGTHSTPQHHPTASGAETIRSGVTVRAIPVKKNHISDLQASSLVDEQTLARKSAADLPAAVQVLTFFASRELSNAGSI